LAVTGALFISVAYMLNGRQAETQFNQALRDYESKIQSVANDVSSGFYETGVFNCIPGAGSSPVTFNNVPPIQEAGTNQNCIFLGKMITTNTNSSDIFTVMGRRISGGLDVKTIAEATPAAVYQPPLDITEGYTHRFGLQLRRAFVIGTATSVGGFGFISELAGGAALSAPVTGSRGVLLYRLGSTVAPNNQSRQLNDDDMAVPANYIRADEGIRLCFWDGGRRRGEITIGANASQTSTFVTAGSGVSSDCL
jgi:hypothetical protein